MMIPHMMMVYLKFLGDYLTADSVVPDMADLEKVVPGNLKWSIPIEQQLLQELFTVAESPAWKLVKRDKTRNITFESLHSTAYMRRLIRGTAVFQADVKSVVDTCWTDFWVSGSWHSAVAEHKLLTYGGEDRYAMWQESDPMAGGAVAARNFDVFLLRKDCIVKKPVPNKTMQTNGEFIYESNGHEYCADGTPNVVLYTNTSDQIHYQPTDEAVRASYGTSGMIITAKQKSPPLTEFVWIWNADFNLPTVLPDPLGTRIVVGQLLRTMQELKNHLEHGGFTSEQHSKNKLSIDGTKNEEVAIGKSSVPTVDDKER